MKKRILSALLAALLAMLCLSGCKSNDGTGYLFRYNLSDDPSNLDPQLASDAESLAVIKNIYTGLMRISETGALVNGVAESYSVSKDGLTYTFNLRNDNYWYGTNDEYIKQLTAKDFEYAFERLFNPITSSPYREDFMCIKNAADIIDGTADYGEIGVKAVSDSELVIELDYADADFLTLLTTAAAMPCNQDFFYSTSGKYGLDSEFILSNGPFYVYEWEYDPYGENNHLILRKNKNYSETESISPSSLNFFIEKDYSKSVTDFTKKNTDCIVVGGEEKSLLNGDYSYTEYQSITYGIVFNQENESFSDERIRKALAYSINRAEFEQSTFNGRSGAYAVVPSATGILNKSYRELIAETSIDYFDESTATALWNETFEEMDLLSISKSTILVCDGEMQNTDDLSGVTEQWQRRLDFYCGIEVVPRDEYYRRIEDGEYTMALYTLTSDKNSPEGFIEKFGTGGNVYGAGGEDIDEIMLTLHQTQNQSDRVKLYSQAESEIVESGEFIPVFYQSVFLVYPTEVEGIGYDPFNEQIDFFAAKNYD